MSFIPQTLQVIGYDGISVLNKMNTNIINTSSLNRLRYESS